MVHLTETALLHNSVAFAHIKGRTIALSHVRHPQPMSAARRSILQGRQRLARRILPDISGHVQSRTSNEEESMLLRGHGSETSGRRNSEMDGDSIKRGH